MCLISLNTKWERVFYPSRKIPEHQFSKQYLICSNCNSLDNLKMYCDSFNTTGKISFQQRVKNKSVATRGFPEPPHTVLTPWSLIKGFMVRGPSKFYKFFRFKKKKSKQTMHTCFEIAFLWCPDGDSWVRNAFSIHLIHFSATEKAFLWDDSALSGSTAWITAQKLY